ncbi:MAG: hypothetical protein JRD93_19740 [Deltaproteobacteria bacterium]|nr:hypothetical protein [Deltaproteobacteria bacterium]
MSQKKYRAFVDKGIGRGRNPEMTGGGLLRSIGGWGVLKSMRRMKIHIKRDEGGSKPRKPSFCKM